MIGQGNVEISGGGGGGAVVQNPYTLPVASGTTLGGIKVGSNLTISPDGTLSATVPTSSGGGTAPSPVLPSASDLFPIGSHIMITPATFSNSGSLGPGGAFAKPGTRLEFGSIVNYTSAVYVDTFDSNARNNLPQNMNFMVRGLSGRMSLTYSAGEGDDTETYYLYLAVRIS